MWTRTTTSLLERCTTDGSAWKRSISRRAGSDTSPTLTAPFPDGQPVGAGFGVDFTTPVGTDVAFRAPSALRAVTRTRSVLSASTRFRTYVLLFVPEITAQLPPFVSQRSHAYVNVGDPDQEPGSAVSVDPSCSVPLTVGGLWFWGTTARAACPSIGSVASATAARPAVASTMPVVRLRYERFGLIDTSSEVLGRAVVSVSTTPKTGPNRLLTAHRLSPDTSFGDTTPTTFSTVS